MTEYINPNESGKKASTTFTQIVVCLLCFIFLLSIVTMIPSASYMSETLIGSIINAQPRYTTEICIAKNFDQHTINSISTNNKLVFCFSMISIICCMLISFYLYKRYAHLDKMSYSFPKNIYLILICFPLTFLKLFYNIIFQEAGTYNTLLFFVSIAAYFSANVGFLLIMMCISNFHGRNGLRFRDFRGNNGGIVVLYVILPVCYVWFPLYVMYDILLDNMQRITNFIDRIL